MGYDDLFIFFLALLVTGCDFFMYVFFWGRRYSLPYFCDYSDFPFGFSITECIINKIFCLEMIFILTFPIVLSNFKVFEVSVIEMLYFVLHVFAYFWFVTK